MPDFASNCCIYTLKTVGIVFAVVGIILSWRSAITCDFISFIDTDGNPPDYADAPPFDRAIAAKVGIFNYQLTQLFDGSRATVCRNYDVRFAKQQDYPSLATAQFCAVLGPLFVAVGVFLSLVDCFVCNYSGSFMVASVFYLLGSGLQAGVFTLVADPVFCFEDPELECKQGRGVYLAATATVFFFIAACFNCCAPRPDTICSCGEDKVPEKKVPKNNGGGATVIVQPVIIDNRPKNKNEKSSSKSNRNGERRPNSQRQQKEGPSSPRRQQQQGPNSPRLLKQGP